MMNAYPGTKKTSWYRFHKRSRNQRGRDYLSRGKLGHHLGKEVTSTSIYKNDRISVKRQSSTSGSIDFEKECDESGSQFKRPIPSRMIKNQKHPMRREHTTEKEKTRYVTLERNSNGPRTTSKCDNREKTFSSGARTYVVRRSKETFNTSSPEKRKRKKLHYTETPSHRLLQVKIKVVDQDERVKTVKAALDTQSKYHTLDQTSTSP